MNNIFNRTAVLILSLVVLAQGTVFAQVTATTYSQEDTIQCLNLKYTLRYRSRDSSTGGDVSRLQNFLIQNGNLEGSVTGMYGQRTSAAVRAFQRDNNISQTGVTGPLTRSMMMRVSCEQGEATTGTVGNSQTANGSTSYCTVDQVYTYNATPNEQRCTCPSTSHEVSVGVPMPGHSQYKCISDVGEINPQNTYTPKKFDLNNDGKIDEADARALYLFINSSQYPSSYDMRYDLNNDGRVNQLDLTAMSRKLADNSNATTTCGVNEYSVNGFCSTSILVSNCANGLGSSGQCQVQGTTPALRYPPTISSMYPLSGKTGDLVTITGSNFSTASNTVRLFSENPTLVAEVSGSSSGCSNSSCSIIRFNVPSNYTNIYPIKAFTPGNYKVSIKNINGETAALLFTVVSSVSSNPKFDIGSRDADGNTILVGDNKVDIADIRIVSLYIDSRNNTAVADFNSDGVVDKLDLKLIRDKADDSQFDIASNDRNNGSLLLHISDGKIDSTDVSVVASFIAGRTNPAIADFNSDGVVNNVDLAIIQSKSTVIIAEKVNLSSVMIDGANLKVTYDKNFDTCVYLVNQNGNKLHQQNLFCEQGTNKIVTVPLSSISNANLLGQLVKLCRGDNYNVCSELTVVKQATISTYPTISLTSPAANADYTIGQTIPILWSVTNAGVNTQVIYSLTGINTVGGGNGGGSGQSVLLKSGSSVGSTDWRTGDVGYLNIPGTYEVSAVVRECSVNGCNYSNFSTVNKSNVARQTITIRATSTSLVEKVNLSSVMIDGANLKVTYDKNFDTCVYLVNQNGNKLHQQNLFCEQGTNKIVTVPLSSISNANLLGQLVKLCRGDNYNVCSPLVTVTGGTVLISCLGGERLDGNVCVKDLGIGTITKGACTILAGKSSCLADVTFTTSYAVSGRTKIVTVDSLNGGQPVVQYEGAYSNGESKKVSVPAYIQEQQVLLYVNDAKAAQNTIKGTCEIGSTWVVSACQKNSVTNMVPKGTDLAISPYSPANVTSTSTIYLEWAPIIFPEFPNISTYGSLSYILKIDGVDYSKGPVQSFIGTPAVLGLTAGTHTLQARVCNQVGCAPWSISVTVNVNTPPPVVEAPAAVPGYNAMSCVSPLLKGVSSGGIGCYGMWDSGNSFGGDVSMCGDYSGLTGCEIKTTACSSGSAIATKVVSPSSLADSQIQVYSTNLKTSVAAVKDNVLKLWEYTCTPVVVSAGHTTSQSLVLGATTMCVNLPRNLHRGDESNDTMNLQKFLYAHDYLTETPSGFYGDMTIKAVKDFQLNKGISATGMVYGVTRAAIANVSCGGI